MMGAPRNANLDYLNAAVDDVGTGEYENLSARVLGWLSDRERREAKL